MKLSLATKIFLGFSLVVAVFGGVSVLGLTQLHSVRGLVGAVNRIYLPLNRVVTELDTLQESSRRSLENGLQIEDRGTQLQLLRASRQSLGRSMQARLDRARDLIRRGEAEPLGTRDARMLQDLLGRLDRIQEVAAGLDEGIGRLQQDAEAATLGLEQFGDLSELMKQARSLAREVRLAQLALKNVITSQMLTVEREESAAIGLTLWLSIVAVVLGMAVTGLALLALRPVRRLAEAARRVSRGDYSPVEVGARDEFGLLAEEFNRMARALGQREQEQASHQQQVEAVNRELKQSSIDLALLKLYNEHIIRSIPNGVVVVNALGTVTTLNPAAVELWSLEPADTIGRRFSDLPFATTLQRLLPEFEAVVAGRQRRVFEAVAFPCPGRGPRLVDVHLTPVLGAEGEAHGLLVLGEEVTEQVQTKQALIQSERLAAIGRMSALVAHEIRNPLSSIGLNTELLEEALSAEGAEGAELVRAIGREVERLTEVTEDYLRFARLPKPSLVPEGLNELLDELLRFMQGELTAAGIRVERELAPEVGLVAADEGQLRQAFLNLLRNSAEAMPQGGTLAVHTARADGRVSVRISDTGQGIAADALARIFEPFFSTREGGTGLGLPLTQQIVQEHGGRIHCESQPGRGTTFTVELPGAPGPAAAPPATQAEPG
ncbi:MAG TPA: ATP-binding protein [Myxococcota bacterium]|nr:ATP-binding protein [Myxococcota bacterium]HRY96455.1 ATP-binding protein [Myxococcota bacterium]HSA22346.1 ATP-binding protein [Myxococcota bacterium]